MSYTAKSLTAEFNNLVSMPEVVHKVVKLVDDVESTISDIGHVINQDPALTARLLKIANSPFYGLSSQVDSVSHAVSVLGTKQIRDLVIATSAIESFKGIPNELISMENFWFHSIACGLAAKKLLSMCKPGLGDAIFIAGLLHDIGQLVMYIKLPEQTRDILLLGLDSEDTYERHIAEKQIMGFDHAQLGGELVKHWKLPNNLLECVEFHHDISQAKQYPLETAIVHIANTLATLVESNSLDINKGPAIDPTAWKITGLSEEVIEPTIDYIKEQIGEVQSMLSAT